MNLCKNRHSFLALRRFFSALAIACLILFLSTPSIWGDIPISGEALPGLEGFDKVMLWLIDKYSIPGASLAVAFNGKLILARGYGYAKKSLTEKIPMQPQSRFRFASLSKPLTAAAIMLLAEEGKLSLDDSIISLLHELGPQKISDPRINQITVRHLLEHRGGFDRRISGDPMLLDQPPCPGNIKSFLARKLDFTPGEKFVYSNIGYCILGRIIEKATRKSYEDFLNERLLKPIGAHSIELGSSRICKPSEVNYYDLPPPFLQGQRPHSASPYGGFNLEAMDAHGGWIGSTIDYLRFLTAIDGQRPPALLQPNTFKMMLAMPDDPTLRDKPSYYAKGFNVRKLAGGGINLWHLGNLPGTEAIAVRTASGYGWVSLFNASTDDHENLEREIDQRLWEGARSVKGLPVGDLFNKY